MSTSNSRLILGLVLVIVSDLLLAGGPTVKIDTPTSPPEWALLERELLRASSIACEEFFARYFDERKRVEEMRGDTTTPDTRLADDPMDYNPAVVTSLIELMEGGLHITRKASVLHARVRYFDPVRRRAGIPEDVAALVETMTDAEIVLSLVNVSQVHARDVLIQSGAYGEHEFVSARIGSEETAVANSILGVRLEPGCGACLILKMKRFVHAPTLSFPWD